MKQIERDILHAKDQLRMSKNQPLRIQYFKDKIARLEKTL